MPLVLYDNYVPVSSAVATAGVKVRLVKMKNFDKCYELWPAFYICGKSEFFSFI